MVSEDVKPTRTVLIETRKRVKLAQEGYELLNQKRDVLMMELFALLKNARGIREELDEQMIKAYERLTIAQVFDGKVAVDSAALSVGKVPEIIVKSKNIMGVNTPAIEGEYIEKNMLTRGYGVLSTSAKIDESAQEFEKSMKMILELAETEEALKRLTEEIQKTQRRVNALEFSLIPELKGVITFIRMKLDELEREDFFRLKLFKSRTHR